MKSTDSVPDKMESAVAVSYRTYRGLERHYKCDANYRRTQQKNFAPTIFQVRTNGMLLKFIKHFFSFDSLCKIFDYDHIKRKDPYFVEFAMFLSAQAIISEGQLAAWMSPVRLLTSYSSLSDVALSEMQSCRMKSNRSSL